MKDEQRTMMQTCHGPFSPDGGEMNMKDPCKGCVDYVRCGGWMICDYIGHNHGRARSVICPAGAACTVKATRPRGKGGAAGSRELRRGTQGANQGAPTGADVCPRSWSGLGPVAEVAQPDRNAPPSRKGKPLGVSWDEGKALELYKRGATDREIGEAVGIKKENIFAWRKRRGLKANREAGWPKREEIKAT